MDFLAIVMYLLIGVFAGFAGGLLGIGGGLVVVPALLFIFHHRELSLDFAMQQAIGTSLAAMVFTAASSAWAHYKQGGVSRSLFYFLSPGIAIGAVLGACIADYLPSAILQRIFGLSICIIGLSFFIPQNIQENGRFDDAVASFRSFLPIGIIIGLISTILGIGGGIITVPILLFYRVPIHNAISTSAATGFVIAVIGALSFLLLGMKQHPSQGSIGYVFLPAFIFISVSSVFAAPYGAKLAYRLPVATLKKVFGVFLIVVGIAML